MEFSVEKREHDFSVEKREHISDISRFSVRFFDLDLISNLRTVVPFPIEDEASLDGKMIVVLCDVGEYEIPVNFVFSA